MPNWCITDYALSGKKENANRLLEDLHKVMNTNRDEDKEPFSFKGCPEWIGYFVTDLLPNVDINDISCRGEISYIDTQLTTLDENNAAVKFSTETAWVACEKFIDLLADAYELDTYYYSEEPGCDIYETNDSEGLFFSFRYMLYNDENGTEYYDKFEDLAEEICSITGKRAESVTELQEILEAYNNDETYWIVNEIDVI